MIALKITNRKFIDALIFLFVFSIILHSNSIFQFMGIISNSIWSILECFLLIYLMLVHMKNRNHISLNKNKFLLLSTYILCTVISFFSNIFNPGDEIAFFIKYIIFVPTAFLLFINGENTFLDKFTTYFINIVSSLAAISLPFYFLGQFFRLISPNISIMSHWGSTIRSTPGFFYIHYISQEFSRNSGIFTEAPMFALILSIALFFTFFKSNKTKHQIIILLALLTTNTLTGISVAFMFVIALYYTKKQRKKSWIKLCMALLVILILPIIFQFFIFYIDLKLQTVGGSNSLMMRADDFVACFKVFCENKLLGIGYGNEVLIHENMNRIRRLYKMVGLANTIGIYLAQGGIVMMIPLITSYICFLKNSQKQYKVFGMLFILLSFISLFLYTNLFLVILSLGLAANYKYKYCFNELIENPSKLFENKILEVKEEI